MQQIHSEARVDASARGRLRSIGPGLVTIALIAIAEVVVGWYRFFSWLQFPNLDDEGYMVVTVREWMQDGGLYDRVFSQYGPFFPVAIGAPLRVVNRELTLDSARALTVLLVVSTSIALALAVLVLTRNVFASVITQAGSFLLLGQIESAALHPAALIALLLALLILNIALRNPTRHRASDVITGALVAAVFLTKVNVGIFAAIAVAYVVAASWPDPRQRRWVRLVPEVALVVVGPVLLIQQIPRLDDVRATGTTAQIWNWVVAYVAAALLAVVIGRLTQPNARDREAPFSLARLSIGFGACVALIVGVVVATGTSPSSLVSGVLIRPADFAGAFTVIGRVPRGAFAWIVLAPLLVLVVTRIVRWAPGTSTFLGSAALRAAAAGALLLTALPGLATTVIDADFGRFIVVLPLVALVLVPAVDRDALERRNARLFVVALSITQSLHAFPVSGIQVALAMSVPLVCAALLLDDAGRELMRVGAPAAGDHSAHTRWLRLVPAAAIVVLMVVPLVSQSRSWIDRYDNGTSLALPGASRIHTSPRVVAELHQIVDVLSTCDQIVSYPGFNSFSVFARKDPPTGFNTTFADSLLTDDEQQTVVDALESTSGTICYFHIRGADPLPPADGPLAVYLAQFTETVEEGRSWSILAREQA